MLRWAHAQLSLLENAHRSLSTFYKTVSRMLGLIVALLALVVAEQAVAEVIFYSC